MANQRISASAWSDRVAQWRSSGLSAQAYAEQGSSRESWRRSKPSGHQQAKLTRQDALLAEKDFKIKALTHELAYYRRVRFGKASEALSGEQRLLFEEAVDADLAA
jgi:hypothetical protein